MQFNWQGTEVTLQGIRDNIISEVSSHQLKRMQNKSFILEFFHLEMHLSNEKNHTDLELLPPSIAPMLH